ncbi:MAG: alternative ribosome rescue aminoacyl-tRNA hydrolase ArfB [Solirubrobacteraceae bacterium]
MQDELQIAQGLSLPAREVTVRASRSSGPGGQHANVTASRIEASFDVQASQTLSEVQKQLLTERLGPRVVAIAQDARSQARNRELALQRLAEKLAAGLAVDAPRTPTRPSRAKRARRLDDKRRQGERKRARRPPDPGE